jgi:hypothetical protein
MVREAITVLTYMKQDMKTIAYSKKFLNTLKTILKHMVLK